eukprot:764095-Hanusia_phi.AAC.3
MVKLMTETRLKRSGLKWHEGSRPHEDTSSVLGDLPVEDRVEDGIKSLDVGDEDRSAEAQGALEVLHEGGVKKRRLGDLPVLVLRCNVSVLNEQGQVQ